MKKIPPLLVVLFIFLALFSLLYQTQKMDIIYLVDNEKEINIYYSQYLKTEIKEIPIICRQILPNGDYVDTPLTLTQKLKNGSNFNDYTITISLPHTTDKLVSCLNFKRIQAFIDKELAKGIIE